MSKNKNICFGCVYFYITHKKQRPYGCRAFGFISKIAPSLEVFYSSGTQCAYKKDKKHEIISY